MTDDAPPELPQYQPPPGLQTASRKDAGHLTKIIGKMLSPKIRAPRVKGIQAPQSVKFSHGKHKTKSMKPVNYW
jgi:hypothetical protein